MEPGRRVLMATGVVLFQIPCRTVQMFNIKVTAHHKYILTSEHSITSEIHRYIRGRDIGETGFGLTCMHLIDMYRYVNVQICMPATHVTIARCVGVPETANHVCSPRYRQLHVRPREPRAYAYMN